VRPARVVVRGLDPTGKERCYEGTDLLARAFCHEIDHIDGLLFVDRLTPLKRDLLKRKLRKKARAGDWEE
jgi:peptide deformylase